MKLIIETTEEEISCYAIERINQLIGQGQLKGKNQPDEYNWEIIK